MIKVLKIFVKIKPLINANFYKPILHIQIYLIIICTGDLIYKYWNNLWELRKFVRYHFSARILCTFTRQTIKPRCPSMTHTFIIPLSGVSKCRHQQSLLRCSQSNALRLNGDLLHRPFASDGI